MTTTKNKHLLEFAETLDSKPPGTVLGLVTFTAAPILALGVLIGMGTSSLRASGEKLSLQNQLKATEQAFEQFRATTKTQNQLLDKLCNTVEELNNASN